ncbi:hypothetical protein Taro_007487 [Colocasia esculenta]|uniref:Uncharacterized protein n=1 Tax=Colocasia esculenta TaxID=4460 RepID=A0A843U0H5_COLES|nr:hypothetical protein [Colocasia esculenta]
MEDFMFHVVQLRKFFHLWITLSSHLLRSSSLGISMTLNGNLGIFFMCSLLEGKNFSLEEV